MSKYEKILKPILVVDDEPEIRQFLTEAIEDLGLKSIEAEDGEQGLALCQKEDPFLVITDLSMPNKTGLEMAQDLKSSGTVPPILLLTAFADKDSAINATNNGVRHIIEKPIQLEKVTEFIEEVARSLIEEIEEEERENLEIRTLYVEEARDLLDGLDEQLLRLEDSPIDPMIIDSIFRAIHSVKGGAGAVQNAETLAGLGHSFESSLSLIRKGEICPNSQLVNVYLQAADLCVKLLDFIDQGAQPDEGIVSQSEEIVEILDKTKEITGENSNGVSAPAPIAAVPKGEAGGGADSSSKEDEGVFVTNEKLDSFMKLSGELIVFKNFFQILSNEISNSGIEAKQKKKLYDLSYTLNKLTDQLQDQIMSVRKINLDRTFSKFPRIVRQVAQDVGKKVKLEMIGMELGVDKNIAKALSSSMTHIVRNCVDHGLESTEGRLEAGKSETGNVTISAQEKDGQILIEVKDDGRGINEEAVAKKAIENGLVTESQIETMSKQEIHDLIFMAGFSTASAVTNISGRGVGMDAVKSAVETLHGSVSILSEAGVGSTFSLVIPSPKTVMIEETVIVRSRDIRIAVPLPAIAQILSGEKVRITTVSGQLTCQLDGRTVPLTHYHQFDGEVARYTQDELNQRSIVFVDYKDYRVGLIVDEILDQLEAVVRPFDRIVGSFPGLKGTTVLGDDSIAYVLDYEKLVIEVMEKEDGETKTPPGPDVMLVA